MSSVDLSVHHIPTGEIPTQTATSCSPSSSTLPTSSFSSIMSSPLAGRLSFQTLTNFIPSWGTTTPPRPQIDALGHDSVPVAPPVSTVKRGYVSKQSQLERLKSRLEREGLEARTTAAQKSDDAVFL
ncbi:hypothetical protein B0H10DRAFT_389132 [Mycena sp. CBHHK59/15]|nr:hypothetical protein B0H10DRAFT_389132 [Mycena sp. CBHHK59/15]